MPASRARRGAGALAALSEAAVMARWKKPLRRWRRPSAGVCWIARRAARLLADLGPPTVSARTAPNAWWWNGKTSSATSGNY
jgi:hypothetical protein